MKNITNTFDTKLFNSLLLMVRKFTLRSISLWISMILITYIFVALLYFPFFVFRTPDIINLEHDPKMVAMMSWFVLLSTSTFILIGMPITFSQVGNSIISDKIGSSGTSKTKFIIHFWIVYSLISLIVLLGLNVLFIALCTPFMAEFTSIFQRFIPALIYEILFVLLVSSMAMFISTIRINVIAKQMWGLFIILTYVYLNYVWFSLLNLLSGYDAIWFLIIKYIYLIFINILVIPSTLISFMIEDPNKVNVLWYALYPFYMILSGTLLLYCSTKIYRY